MCPPARRAGWRGFGSPATPGIRSASAFEWEKTRAQIEDVEISGAIEAGIVLEKGSRAVVRGSYIHDSVGAGIVVRAGAAPELWHNVVTANGKVGGSPVAGIELEEGAAPLLFGNIIVGNGDDQIAGLPAARRSDVARDNIVGAPAPAARPPVRRP